jgi:two-component sensor histidine kinase
VLEPRRALDLAMLLHELATNAIKYGALSLPAGRIEISWTVEAGDAAGLLHLCWREMNGPPVAQPQRLGFGTELIRSILDPHEGKVSLVFAPDGASCSVDMPLSQAKQAKGSLQSENLMVERAAAAGNEA